MTTNEAESSARAAIITTERLFLRHFRERDIATLLAYRNDPEISRYQSWTTISEVTARHFVTQMAPAEPGKPDDWFQFAIELRSSGEHIGDVGLHTLEHARLGEIGYTLAASAQGHGFATEAVDAVVDYAFQTLKMHRISATVDVENLASMRLLERLGFRLECTQIEADWFKGRWSSIHQYATLAREWRESRKSQ